MKKDKNIITCFTKLVLYLVFICGTIIAAFNIPKELLTKEETYNLVASFSDIESDIVLMDYKVFGSQKKFEEVLISESKNKVEEFKENGDVLLVKIHGDEYSASFKDSYWYVEDPNILELNIEYYVVKNINVAGTSIPVHTVYQLMNDIICRISEVGLMVIAVLTFLLCLPFAISISKQVFYIINLMKKKEMHN